MNLFHRLLQLIIWVYAQTSAAALPRLINRCMWMCKRQWIYNWVSGDLWYMHMDWTHKTRNKHCTSTQMWMCKLYIIHTVYFCFMARNLTTATFSLIAQTWPHVLCVQPDAHLNSQTCIKDISVLNVTTLRTHARTHTHTHTHVSDIR